MRGYCRDRALAPAYCTFARQHRARSRRECFAPSAILIVSSNTPHDVGFGHAEYRGSTRRDFLRALVATGSTVAIPGLLAACNSSALTGSAGTPTGGTPAGGTPAAGATVTVDSIAALQSAIAAATSGDVIALANGTYLNTALTFATSGITVRAASPGGVTLNGTNAIVITGSRVRFSGFQFRTGSIDGFVIAVAGSDNHLTQLNFSGYAAQKYVVFSAPSQRNQLSFSNFQGKPPSAPSGNLVHIEADPVVPGYHWIHHCSFQQMLGNGGDFGNEPIRLSNGAQSAFAARTLVEYCYWNDTARGDSESISVKCRENVIRYCTFVNNPDGMLVFRNGNDNMAYGNFFIGAGGIRVKEASNIWSFNNYFERAGVGGTAGAVTYDYVPDNLRNLNFLHNTFVECGAIDLGGPGATGDTWANNVFQKASGALFTRPNGATTWTGNLYAGILGIPVAAGMRLVDPMLSAATDGYRGLMASSPCIDSADPAYPRPPDIVGRTVDSALRLDVGRRSRPADARAKDVGCVEYNNDATSNRPLTLADVGPMYLGGPSSA